MAMFTRHIDRNREGTEWGIYYTLVDFVSAITASIGGVIAATAGFVWLIITLSSIGLIGSSLLYAIRKHIRVE
jgi:hypothetical protein